MPNRNVPRRPRQRGPGTRAQLGELPEDYRKTGRMQNPGLGLSPYWINYTTATNFPFTIGVLSRIIIPANPLRVYVLIQNKNAANDMFVNFGSKATDYNGIIIIPRGNYELIGGAIGGAFCPMDSIHVLGSAADLDGVIVEGVYPPNVAGG